MNTSEEKKMGVYEIAQDITAEQMSAVFFDSQALREPNYRLCQLNARGQRYYYVMNEDGTELYPSVTTILKKVMPENTILTNWKLDLGREASEAYTMERARFGTFVHGLLQELMITRKFDLSSVREKLGKYIEREHLPISFMEHEEEVKYNLLSFAKWIRDYDVRPLAVEICLYHPELKFAGMLDLVCSMRTISVEDEAKAIEKAKGKEDKIAEIRKEGAKRITAIVDYKTTTKAFHDSHAIQLGLYKMMWDATFTDVPIDAIANVSPKEWWNTQKKQVSYQFEWQSENEVLKQIPYLLELYKLLPTETKRIPLCAGVIDLNEDVATNVTVLTLEELVDKGKKEMREEDAPEASEGENDLFPEF